jgi:carbon storage regulator
MLVLTRRPGEEVVIGDRIHVTVTLIGNDRVRLGITAPPDVPVHRAEVYERIREFASPTEPAEACGRTGGVSNPY